MKAVFILCLIATAMSFQMNLKKL